MLNFVLQSTTKTTEVCVLNSVLLEGAGSTLRRTGFLQPLRSFEDTASESSSGAHTQNSCSACWLSRQILAFLLPFSEEGAELMLASARVRLVAAARVGEQLLCDRVRAVLIPPSFAVWCFITLFYTAEILMVKTVLS